MLNWPLVFNLLVIFTLQQQCIKCQQPFFERAPASRISWASNFTSNTSPNDNRRSGHPEDLFINPASGVLELPPSAFDDFTATFFGPSPSTGASNNNNNNFDSNNNNQPNRRREPVSFRAPFNGFNTQPFVDGGGGRARGPPQPSVPPAPLDERRGNNFNGNFRNNNNNNNNNFARVNNNNNNNVETGGVTGRGEFNRPVNNGANVARGRGVPPGVISNVRSTFEQPRPWSPETRGNNNVAFTGGSGPSIRVNNNQPNVRNVSPQPQARRIINQPNISLNSPRLPGEVATNFNPRNNNNFNSGATFNGNPNNINNNINNNFNAPASSSSSLLNPVTSSCLSCLCVASTGCDLKKQCVGEFCGPFLISWPYWSDAGKPGGDYVKCALNRECAEAAVQGYMKKWTRDCNGDGVVDCDDYAAIHKLGPHMCREDSVTSTPYWSAYETCSARSRVSSSSSLSGQPVNSFTRASSSPINNIRGRGRSNSDFTLATTARPSFDLPLITPRRRLTSSNRQENPDGSPSTITRNFVESTGNNLPLNATFNDNNDRLGISKECFECMCEASSGCERDIRCNTPDRDTQVCGPYQLDRSYWRLAGRPGFAGSQNDFELCASDTRCAEDTMSKFMKRMSFDCNEDGVVDCLDYAAIHKAGVKHCNSQWFLESKYWSQFERCYGFSR